MSSTTSEKFARFLSLNVGGVRFDTSPETVLRAAPSSRLARIVQKEYRDLELGEELFIDRNGAVFQHILEYLRHPEECIPPRDKITLENLQIEAKFFELPALQAKISEMLESYPFAVGDLVRIRSDLDAIPWSCSTQTMMWAEQRNNDAAATTPTGEHHNHSNCPCKWKIKQKLKAEIRERRDYVGVRGKVLNFPQPGKCALVNFVFQQEESFVEKECNVPLVALEKIY